MILYEMCIVACCVQANFRFVQGEERTKWFGSTSVFVVYQKKSRGSKQREFWFLRIFLFGDSVNCELGVCVCERELL